MDKIKQQLLGGTFLMYLSVNTLIIGPSDNKITTIVGPYVLLVLGLGLLIFGLAIVFSARELSIFTRFALTLGYPLIAAGGSMIAFNWIGVAMRVKDMGLLLTNWGMLLLGMGMIIVGFILIRAIKRSTAP